ncbi:MAG: short-chain dehydrogenase [Desulfobacterota bacterium]|nr:short-chain dehydrogenase [Thermodesulfobacteriota bacterium]MDW8001688.1 short-chain dehydrogenase [Deltaproteobacteria bacterium]
MEITGSTVMILGAYGEVGMALTKQILAKNPKKVFVSSLRKEEVEELLEKISSYRSLCEIVPFWGNLFVRKDLKDIPSGELGKRELSIILKDSFDDLTEDILNSSSLFSFIVEYRPEIVIDCINTATALAYTDIYSFYESFFKPPEASLSEETLFSKILLASGLPFLVRHIQILQEALKRANVKIYVKVGTTGTGGMGLNIPFTHGEEMPSKLLMMKSAFAGAHSMLLFVMSRTPGLPIIKEVKPATMIAWKGIATGTIIRSGKPIKAYDSRLDRPFILEDNTTFTLEGFDFRDFEKNEFIEGTYIDTGENGYLSPYEFKAITELGLMEFVTPEEVAKAVLDCIEGVPYAKDVISGINSSVIGSTYRAGILRDVALAEIESYGGAGFSYGLLGPKVSKLIFEASILKICFTYEEDVIQLSPSELSRTAESFILQKDNPLRKEALSIGIPILLPDGKKLLFAKRQIPDKAWEQKPWTINEENVERFAEKEWIDLRDKNMERWQKRIETFTKSQILSFPKPKTQGKTPIDPGKLTAWVLRHEMGGGRVDSYWL